MMRHPGRRFPGILIQGDSLYGICQMADAACRAARATLSDDQYEPMNKLRNWLRRLSAIS
jgi:hypothetical protein